jgi:hypothetical protein
MPTTHFLPSLSPLARKAHTMQRNAAHRWMIVSLFIISFTSICTSQSIPTIAPTRAANNNNQSSLIDGCEKSYYETEIKISSTENISCTHQDVMEMRNLINERYDEVMALDHAIMNMTVTFDTTVCLPNVLTSTQRRGQELVKGPTKNPTKAPTTRPTVARKFRPFVTAEIQGM